MDNVLPIRPEEIGKLTLAECIDCLRVIARRMDVDDLDVERAFELFEGGKAVSARARAILDDYRRRLDDLGDAA